MQYLIWSFEHNAWWGWGRRGYVHKIGAAGLYTQDEAIEICEDANLAGLNEAMVPVSTGHIETEIAMYEQQQEPEPDYRQVTRDMAMDAGDRSLEGTWIKS